MEEGADNFREKKRAVEVRWVKKTAVDEEDDDDGGGSEALFAHTENEKKKIHRVLKRGKVCCAVMPS